MGHSYHFLLVEDNELDVEKIERTFKKLQITNPVYVANDGVEALEMLNKQGGDALPRPLIVLLDLNMPRMGGLEFLTEIRNEPSLKSLQVFVLTTSDEKSDIEHSHANNVAGYIIKPIDRDKLVEAFSILDSFWSLCEQPVITNKE